MSKSKKKKQNDTDVIIVGGGIAGCVLAFHLSNARFKVKVFEKNPRHHKYHNWCDSVEKEAFSYSGIPSPKGVERKNDRDHLAILSPDLENIVHLDYYNYWIVDRKLLEERILKLAEKAGAEFIFDTEIVEPIGRGQWVVGVKKKDDSIETARLVIDCSGTARVLASNIEVLDLNIKIEETDLVKAHRELHEITDSSICWNEHSVEEDVLYYRYNYEKGYSWVSFEEKNKLDVGSGVCIGYTKRSPNAIVNDFVNSRGNIKKEKIRGGGDFIIIRRPTTMVWYGFMAVGEAACQNIPTNGCGIGSAMKAATMAAEVAMDCLNRKEVSIDSLWEYQVRFTQERGKHLAALDMLRRHVSLLTEEEFSFLVKKRILTKKDFENIIHATYKPIGPLKMLVSAFRGVTRLKLLLRLSKAITMSNKIFRHYKKIPKKYHTQRYKEWLLGQLYLFSKIEKND